MGTVHAKDHVVQPNIPQHEEVESIAVPVVKKVVAIDDLKLKVQRLKVTGLCKTKTDIIVEQVKPLLSADSLQDVLLGVQEAQQKLLSLEVFNKVEVLLDTAKGPQAKRNHLDVTFYVEEAGRVKLGMSAHAGRQSGDASLSLGVRNVFGRAEQLRLTSSTTLPDFGLSQQLEFYKRYYADLDKKLFLSLGRTKTDHSYSGFQEMVTGSLAQIQFPSWLGDHKLFWSLHWREIFGFPSNVPMQVRSNAGHSLKSSLTHTLEVDKRDSVIDPYEGYYAQIIQEFAGIGGDTVFGKAEIHAGLYQQIWNDLVGSLTFWTGIMRPITPSRINDRFHLGGATTVRGFGMWGIGPHDSGYSLGGQAYWAAGLHLYHPLPFLQGPINEILKTHLFLTTGNLFCYGGLTPSELKGKLQQYRLSFGFGLLLNLRNGKLELNYCVPLRTQPSDRIQPGLGFGIGFEFL